MSDVTITVTMTQTVEYEKDYTLQEFAELLGVEPTRTAVEAVINTHDDDWNEDLGVVGYRPGLLDDLAMETNIQSVSDREWNIFMEGGAA